MNMKYVKFVFVWSILFQIGQSKAQLTGISLGYGKDVQTPYVQNPISSANALQLNLHKYLRRFWSGSVNYRFSSGNLNMDSIVPYVNNQLGISLSYWFLSDLRLLGKMERRSCKGKLVALNYKQRSYLSAGVFLNQSKVVTKEYYLSYSLGIGFNFWQWKMGRSRRFAGGNDVLLIPFVEAHYTNSFSQITLPNNLLYPNQGFLANVGFKLARP